MFPVDVSVIYAETLFTDSVIEHNLLLLCNDHTDALFRDMFLDSAVAKCGSGHTKTSHIADTMAKDDSKQVAAIVQWKPFLVAAYGSNDIWPEWFEGTC